VPGPVLRARPLPAHQGRAATIRSASHPPRARPGGGPRLPVCPDPIRLRCRPGRIRPPWVAGRDPTRRRCRRSVRADRASARPGLAVLVPARPAVSGVGRAVRGARLVEVCGVGPRPADQAAPVADQAVASAAGLAARPVLDSAADLPVVELLAVAALAPADRAVVPAEGVAAVEQEGPSGAAAANPRVVSRSGRSVRSSTTFPRQR
jgi:hypothetical protein